jgi:hypothetical protein
VDGCSSGCWIWVICSSQGSFLDFVTLQYYIDTIGDLVFGYVFIFFSFLFFQSRSMLFFRDHKRKKRSVSDVTAINLHSERANRWGAY